MMMSDWDRGLVIEVGEKSYVDFWLLHFRFASFEMKLQDNDCKQSYQQKIPGNSLRIIFSSTGFLQL